LADEVIDMDSPAAIKQYIRDVENALEDMEDSSARASGYVRTVTREKAETDAKIEQLNRNIDLIMGDGNVDNDHLAIVMDVELQGLETRAAELVEEVAEADEVAGKLNEAASKLRARHREMVQGLQRIEALDRSTKAKEAAANAIEKAGEVAAGVDHVSVDNVEARLRARADTADVKFERAMGSITESVDQQVAVANAAKRLAERKARLASTSTDNGQSVQSATSAS
jgi:phage shock protein A